MRKYRSYFWPLILIGAGTLLLLSNMGVVEPTTLYQLVNLWPLILIAAGVNLMFGRDNEWVGLAVGVTMLALVVLFLVFAPQLDLPEYFSTKEFVSDSFSESFGDTESYSLIYDGVIGDVLITDGVSTGNLVDVVMEHNVDSYFNVTGSDHKEISLGIETDSDFWFSPLDWFNSDNWFNSEDVFVNVNLDASVPADFQVEITSGNLDLLLQEFELTEFYVSQTSGNSEIVLPSGDYPTMFDSTSGDMNVTLSDDMLLDLNADMTSGDMSFLFGEENYGSVEIEITSGRITLNIPAGLGVQVEVDSTSGSTHIPSDFSKVSGDNKVVGDYGIWQNDAYDSDGQNLEISLDMTSGSLTVHVVD